MQEGQKHSPFETGGRDPRTPGGPAAGRVLVHMLLIALLGAAAYSNTFDVPFHWDGKQFIEQSQIVRDLGHFTDMDSARERDGYRHMARRYVVYLSFALNYAAHEYKVAGYHAVNLAVHISNALLLYLLILALLRSPALAGSRLVASSAETALFAALLFVSHPIQTMAVTYIYQRLASLVAFFYLLAVLMYVLSRLADNSRKGWALYALCLVFAVLAMKSKENAFTLPLSIAMIEFVFFKATAGARAARLVPLMLTMLIVPLGMMGAAPDAGSLAEQMDSASRIKDSWDRPTYLFSQTWVLLTYLGLLVFPLNLSLLHDVEPLSSLLEPKVLAASAVLLGLFGLALYLLWRSRVSGGHLRLASFGIFFYFITLSVESSVIPLTMKAQEHRMYLPFAGLFATIAIGAAMLRSRVGARRSALALTAVLLAVPLVLGVLTFSRNKVWKTELGLWQDVVRKTPDNSHGYTNLGIAYEESGNIEAAEALFRKSIELDPDFEKPYNNLGKLLRAKGEKQEALRYFTKAVELDPLLAEAHNNLGAIHREMGNRPLALKHLKETVRLRRDFHLGHYNLGNYYLSGKDYANAVVHFKKSLELSPGFLSANTNIGAAYLATGSTDKAIYHFRRSLGLAPSVAKSHFNLGYALMKAGKAGEAEDEFLAALRIDPEYRRARKHLNAIRSGNK